MKTIRILLLCGALAGFASISVAPLLSTGCAGKTPQKVAVDSLASLGLSVNAAYEGYLSLVVQGQLPTNAVPQVTGYYRDFQTAFGAAAAGAQWATNATLANPDLIAAAAKVTGAIATIKNGGR